jgi:hypothetical protein
LTHALESDWFQTFTLGISILVSKCAFQIQLAPLNFGGRGSGGGGGGGELDNVKPLFNPAEGYVLCPGDRLVGRVHVECS